VVGKTRLVLLIWGGPLDNTRGGGHFYTEKKVSFRAPPRRSLVRLRTSCFARNPTIWVRSSQTAVSISRGCKTRGGKPHVFPPEGKKSRTKDAPTPNLARGESTVLQQPCGNNRTTGVYKRPVSGGKQLFYGEHPQVQGRTFYGRKEYIRAERGMPAPDN